MHSGPHLSIYKKDVSHSYGMNMTRLHLIHLIEFQIKKKKNPYLRQPCCCLWLEISLMVQCIELLVLVSKLMSESPPHPTGDQTMAISNNIMDVLAAKCNTNPAVNGLIKKSAFGRQ